MHNNKCDVLTTLQADEICRLEGLLLDQYDRESARGAMMKANYERIKRAIQHSASCSLRKTPLATSHSSSLHWKAHVGSLTAWHVAEIYNHQLEDAHHALRVANAELFLLRQHPSSSALPVACAAQEVAQARESAQRAELKVKELQEELSTRPDAGSYERLKRQADVMTRRLRRLEGWKSQAKSGIQSSPTRVHAARPRTGSGASPLFVLPAHVACGLLEEVASTLGISDPFQLSQGAKKLKRDSEGASQLQMWLDDVCQVVFGPIGKNLRGVCSSRDPKDIPEILNDWIKRLNALEGVPIASNATEATPVAALTSVRVHASAKNHFRRVQGKTVHGDLRNPVSKIAASRWFPEVQIFVPSS
jgi:hypothetical protein